MLVTACLAAVLLAAAVEAELLRRARRAVPIRVHVNGTRGKSTVTRLIWCALREAGIPALAKTTGTEARLLFPDGTERPLRRFGRANIREQVRALLLARRVGARALVVECMALQPELQWIAERRIFRSTIGVITNVRLDHTDVMGRTLDEIAVSLSNTIPRSGVTVIGGSAGAAVLVERARALGSRVVRCDPVHDGWYESNRAVALATARELGIPDAVALAGMPAEPLTGATGWSSARRWLNALAANDPESLRQLIEEQQPRFAAQRTLTVYNHRADRASRMQGFAASHFCAAPGSTVWVTGDQPAWTLWRKARRLHRGALRYVRPSALRGELSTLPESVDAIVFCGNTRGLDAQTLKGLGCHG